MEILIVPRGRVHGFDAVEIYPREYQKLYDLIKTKGKAPISFDETLRKLKFTGVSYSLGDGAHADVGEICSVPAIRLEFPDIRKLKSLEEELEFKI